MHLAVFVGHLEVGELLPHLLALGSLLLLYQLLHALVAQELVAGGLQQFLLLVLAQADVQARIVEGADGIVVVLLQPALHRLVEGALQLVEVVRDFLLAGLRGLLVAVLSHQLLQLLARGLLGHVLLHYAVVVSQGCRALAALYLQLVAVVGECRGVVLEGKQHHLREFPAADHQLGHGRLFVSAAQGKLTALHHSRVHGCAVVADGIHHHLLTVQRSRKLPFQVILHGVGHSQHADHSHHNCQ